MRKLSLCLSLVVSLSALAQSPAMKPFDINMDRVKVSTFGGNFAGTKTYLVPTYTIHASVLGSVWAKKGGANAHGMYYVSGLDKAFLQDLATKLQDDLVKKLRGGGYTVLTYADVKGEPDVTGHSLMKVDDRFGLPSGGGFGAPVTFLIADPSDAQSFDVPVQGPGWWLRGIAKAKDLTVIVPDLTFTTPQMFGQTTRNVFVDAAGEALAPAILWQDGRCAGDA